MNDSDSISTEYNDNINELKNRLREVTIINNSHTETARIKNTMRQHPISSLTQQEHKLLKLLRAG